MKSIRILLLSSISIYFLLLSLKNSYEAFREFKAFKYAENHSVRKLNAFYDEANKKGVFTTTVKINRRIKRYLPQMLKFAVTGSDSKTLQLKKVTGGNNEGKLELSKDNIIIRLVLLLFTRDIFKSSYNLSISVGLSF